MMAAGSWPLNCRILLFVSEAGRAAKGAGGLAVEGESAAWGGGHAGGSAGDGAA
jgi:hypothetical protein